MSQNGLAVRRWSGRWRALRCLLTLALASVARPARAEPSRPRPILELDADASRLVDARLAERLVVLETRDIDVPAASPATPLSPLYFRVLRSPPASLRVELWELGKSEGVRNVSATGSTALQARRVALVAAELARTFREHRLAEIAAREREAARVASVAGADDGMPIYARLGYGGGGRFLAFASAYAAGPVAELSLRFRAGPRVVLDAAWLAGQSRAEDVERSLRFLEIGLAASHAAPLSRGLALDVGFHGKLGSVRVGGHEALPATDTWSARAGLSVRLDFRLGRSLSLAVGPEVSAFLRRVEPDIGGLAAGGSATLVALP